MIIRRSNNSSWNVSEYTVCNSSNISKKMTNILNKHWFSQLDETSVLFVGLIFLCVFRTSEDRRDSGSTRPQALQCWWVHAHWLGPKEKFNTTVSPFQLKSKLISITRAVAFNLGQFGQYVAECFNMNFLRPTTRTVSALRRRASFCFCGW